MAEMISESPGCDANYVSAFFGMTPITQQDRWRSPAEQALPERATRRRDMSRVREPLEHHVLRAARPLMTPHCPSTSLH
eukprot:6296241-Amphidinium_carterae.2